MKRKRKFECILRHLYNEILHILDLWTFAPDMWTNFDAIKNQNIGRYTLYEGL